MIDPALPAVTPVEPTAAEATAPIDPETAALFAALLGLGVQPTVAPAVAAGGTVGVGSADGSLDVDAVLGGLASDPTGGSPARVAILPGGAVPAAAAEDGDATGAATASTPVAEAPVAGEPAGAPTPAAAPPSAAVVTDPDGAAVAGDAPGVEVATPGVPVAPTTLPVVATAAALAAAPAVARPGEGEPTTASPGGPEAIGPSPAKGREVDASTAKGRRDRDGETPSERSAAGSDATDGARGVSVAGATAADESARLEGTGGLDRERFDRLVEGLAARLRVSQHGEGARVRMQLSPRELGEVVVRLEIRDGIANAHLIAETPDAGRLLAAAAHDLRQALAERGVQVDRLDVRVAGEAGARSDARHDRADAGHDARGGRPAARVAGVTEGRLERSTGSEPIDEHGVSLLA